MADQTVPQTLFEFQPWIIPTGTAILGLIAGWLLKSHDRNTALALANVQIVREKTEQMLRALGGLNDYFEPFAAESGNEYVDHADPADWAPLSATSTFVKEVTPLMVWLGQQTREAVDMVIERACSCFTPALHFAGAALPEFDREETVRSLSAQVLEAIEGVHLAVQADLGLGRTLRLLRKLPRRLEK